MISEATPPAAAPQSASPLRRWLYLLTGLAIGGGFLYFTARNVDLKEAATYIYAIDKRWLLPLISIVVLNHVLRSVRWRLMFPETCRPSLRHTFDALVISKVANNFIPGRLGDLLRVTIIGRLLSKVGISGALATMVVEKIFDIFAILAMLGIALLAAPMPEWLVKSGVLGVGLFAALLSVLWLLDRTGSQMAPANETGHTDALTDKIKIFLSQRLRKFSGGLYAVRHAHSFTRIGLYTIVIWTLEVTMIFLCFQAFSIEASFLAALVCIVFLCAGLMLPAAPGFIGTYQLFIVAALQLFDVAETQAFAMAVFLNLLLILLTSTMGLLVFVVDGGLLNIQHLSRFFGKSQ